MVADPHKIHVNICIVCFRFLFELLRPNVSVFSSAGARKVEYIDKMSSLRA
jgi:hypothetical protein